MMHFLRFLVVVMVMVGAAGTSLADWITPEQAEAAARHWLRFEARQQKFAEPPELTELVYWEMEGETVAYVASFEPGGFMVLPLVSELAPVKYISFTADFEVMRDHPFLMTMAHRYRRTLAYLGYTAATMDGRKAIRPLADVDRRIRSNETVWNLLLEKDGLGLKVDKDVGPMLTSHWDQGHPFNLYTPSVSGQQTLTGCSATSQAQLMNYWAYPAEGQGYHEYEWNSQILGADFGHTYDWGLMLNDYTGAEPQANIDAMARLMSDVGISIDMSYGLSGSGAPVNKNNSLVEFFKYSTDAVKVYWVNYGSWDAWFDLFRNQIDYGWPCLLGTWADNGPGHALVLDGYRTMGSLDQIHANLGWGGDWDGYYSMDDIVGFGQEIDLAVVNIHPPSASGPTVDLTLHSRNVTQVPVRIEPPDTLGFGDGETDCVRIYRAGIEAHFEVPPHHQGVLFSHWNVDGTPVVQRDIVARMDQSQTVEIVYDAAVGHTVPLSEAIDRPTTSWIGGSSDPWGHWYGQTAESVYGGAAACSGPIPDMSSTFFEFNVTGPGWLSFYWKVSSETDFDFLRFYRFNMWLMEISGETDWQYCSVYLRPGNNTLRWAYEKDQAAKDRLDCGWVDRVEFFPAADLPRNPPRLGYITRSGYANSVAAQGDYAYVARSGQGIQVVDVSDPAHPAHVTQFATNNAFDVCQRDDFIFVADYDAGLKIIDVTNPAQPQLVGGCDTPGYAEDVFVLGDYAYVADWYTGVQIIDIRNPAQPVIVGAFPTAGYAHGVFVRDNLAYIAADTGDLQIVDISTPALPVEVGRANTPGGAFGVFVLENYAYLTCWDAGLQVVDISDPARPRVVASCDTAGSACWNPWVDRNHVFVPDMDGGLLLVDISNPLRPRAVGIHETAGQCHGVCTWGDLAFEADGNSGSLKILDISAINQRVIFPRLAFVPGEGTEGYGFVNAGPTEAAVTFTAYDPDGTVLAEADPMAWGAGQQGAYQAEGMLGFQTATEAWVAATVDRPGLLGFFLSQLYDSGMAGMDGADVSVETTTAGVIPRVQGLDDYTTDLFIVNPNTQAAEVTVTGYDENGTYDGGSYTIAANGFLRTDLAGLFGTKTLFDGYLYLESDVGIAANALIRKEDDSISSVNMLPVSGAAPTLYAAHITLFPGLYYTEVNLINPSAGGTNVTLAPFNADGSPMADPIQVSLPARGILRLRDTDLGLPAGVNSDGWLMVNSHGPGLLGCLTFGQPGANQYEATLPLQAGGASDIYFAQVANGVVGSTDFFTGVAIVNPGTTRLQAVISVHASDGALLGQVTRTLAPGEKYVRLLQTIEGIGELPDQSSGFLRIFTDGPVLAFELFGDAELNFLSAVPAQSR